MCSPQHTYRPVISSPLNPAINPAATTTRTGVKITANDCETTVPARARPLTGQATKRPSPSERLLRKKAAQAWKSEALHKQVVEYERQALAAIMSKRPSGRKSPASPATVEGSTDNARRRRRRRSGAPRGSASPADSEGEDTEEGAWEDEESETKQTVVHWALRLQISKLSFLAPTRLIKSLKIARSFATWRLRRRKKVGRT